MGPDNILIPIVLAIIWQSSVIQAGVYKGRREGTVIQLRVPEGTEVTVEYPNQNKPVNFVPYPYSLRNNNNGARYQCQCQNCYKCNNIVQTIPATRRRPKKKTNIIIDLTGKKPKLPSKKESKKREKDDKLTLLEDKTEADSIDRAPKNTQDKKPKEPALETTKAPISPKPAPKQPSLEPSESIPSVPIVVLSPPNQAALPPAPPPLPPQPNPPVILSPQQAPAPPKIVTIK